MQEWGLQWHRSLQGIVLAALAGFFLSFALFFFAILFPLDVLFQAQLLIVGPQEYPTTMNMLVLNKQFQVATAALASFWFWTAVIIMSFFMSWWLLRCFRS